MGSLVIYFMCEECKNNKKIKVWLEALGSYVFPDCETCAGKCWLVWEVKFNYGNSFFVDNPKRGINHATKNNHKTE